MTTTLDFVKPSNFDAIVLTVETTMRGTEARDFKYPLIRGGMGAGKSRSAVAICNQLAKKPRTVKGGAPPRADRIFRHSDAGLGAALLLALTPTRTVNPPITLT